MNHTREINALFTLIDDPDQEVFTTVSERIAGFGKAIIPNLEDLWENTFSQDVQERIENLIHRLHYTDLLSDLAEWSDSSDNDLLSGALLVAKYNYPDLESATILQDIEKIRKNVWLELNNFLTPLEQANVLSSILYNYYSLKGNEVDYSMRDDFFLNKVLSRRKGNALTNGIIYQVLCDLLDINAKVINIPRHFIIAFYHSDYNPSSFIGHPQDKIHFYVDGTTGQAYSHLDIENYLKKMNASPIPGYFKPLSNKRIIQVLLEELSNCYDKPHELEKQTEVLKLVEILS